MTKILVLDAGHGLTTAGKQTLNGSKGVIKEWEMNNAVCNFIEECLTDYDVKIYRTDDNSGKTDIPLATRVNQCNNYNPHLFISIHHNAGGGTGTEVYYHTKGTAEDKKVANLLAPKLATKTGMKNRGVKTAEFTVLTCKATAVLVEGGFMDTQSDYDIITSEKGQRAYAKAVAESVIEYLNLSKKTNAPTTSTIKVGDQVKVKTTATNYATGQSIANFVKGSTYEVTKIDGNKLLLSDITSWVWDYDVEKQGSTSSNQEFMVRIICDELNIRQSASFDSKVVGVVRKGEAFTVTQEKNGLYKLKSGAGWISAGPSYVQKI